MSKSPKVAESVALLDNLGFVKLFLEFLAFVTHIKGVKPFIYKDSTLVITRVTEGGGVTRT
jgi:hypothetical protein